MERVIQYVRSPASDVTLILAILLIHSIEESVVFFSLYYPGTLVIILLYYLVVPDKISTLMFFFTLLGGISLGTALSYFLGNRLGSRRHYKFIDFMLRFLARYDWMWVIYCAWNPNWLAASMFGLGFRGSRFLNSWLLGILGSAVFYSLYIWIGTRTRNLFTDRFEGHQYIVAALILVFGIAIELFESNIDSSDGK